MNLQLTYVQTDDTRNTYIKVHFFRRDRRLFVGWLCVSVECKRWTTEDDDGWFG